MDDDALRRAIARHAWFHSIPLRPGIVTPGGKPLGQLEAECHALLGPLDLTGRSVLDIGAWNGFFSLAAKRRGAARVTAVDRYTWQHPDYLGRQTLELCRRELGLEIEMRELDAEDLPADLGRFEVVLFLGIFYHLVDPLSVLAAVASMTERVLVIETHQDALSEARPAMIHYPDRELDGDPSNWWGPNPEAVYQLLRQHGFGPIYYQDHPLCAPAGPWPLRRRGMYHAFRGVPDDLVVGSPAWLDMADPTVRQALVLS